MKDIKFSDFVKDSDPKPTPSEYSLSETYKEGASAHAAMERNHGGEYTHPTLIRAWTAGWEDAEIMDGQ